MDPRTVTVCGCRCVAAGKASYKLKYYNIPDLKTAAAAPAHGDAGGVPVASVGADADAQEEEAEGVQAQGEMGGGLGGSEEQAEDAVTDAV